MMTNYILDGHDLSDLFSFNTPSISFGEDYKKHVPSFGSIIYTVWDLDEKFIYVGIAGTQNKPVKERNPLSRIREHCSGRRSGDQFCIYVHDFFVLPKIIESGTYKPTKGHLDRLTKEYLHNNLSYRVVGFKTEDSVEIVRALENKIKKGIFGFPPPYLNGVGEQ
jgi:hypothetical protein